MIANVVTDADGDPIDGNGTKLSNSSYQPTEEIKKLFAQVQTDYQLAWRLQHRSFDEFDGISLLDRARIDQQTFGAYVGAMFVPQNKAWRWKGRKNTARNKIIGILAHVISGMLFPYCYAYNEDNEEDAMTAKVMRILVEDYLKKADYETKFLFMMCSALVNPAVFVEVEYVEALQRIKVRNDDGTYRIEEAVDELLSGIGLNIVPIDQILLADFFTFDVQRQPNILRVRRISYDEARSIYGNGKYEATINGTKCDPFDYVQAGMTRMFMTGQEHQTLYDIEWTEADRNYVQVITIYYRPEDLEVTFVGGVFFGNEKDVYNSNPFTHRRMTKIKDKWMSIPVYPFAKGGFEPLDPAGRFAYYKSAAFKEFWDDAGQNRMHQLAYDGTYLDVIKPIFVSGVAKIDGTVMVPGASVGIPQGASVTPYQLGPNIIAAMNMMRQEQQDMSESTQDQIQSGIAQSGVTATAINRAQQNAQTIMQVFSISIADLVRQIGELTIDDIIMHTTVGTVDETIPGSLNMKYKQLLIQNKEDGKDTTNRIEFDAGMIGKDMTKQQANDLEWDMWEKAGGMNSSQVHYKVNPYKFARHQFSLYIDPSMITSRSMGTDQLRKERAFNMLINPAVQPYIDMPAVVDEFILKDYDANDPEKFLKTPEQMAQDQMAQQGGNQQVQGVVPPQVVGK